MSAAGPPLVSPAATTTTGFPRTADKCKDYSISVPGGLAPISILAIEQERKLWGIWTSVCFRDLNASDSDCDDWGIIDD